MANYDEAIEWLDENYPFFLTLVLNIGDPVLTSEIPTAAICDSPNSEEGWEFRLNPSFFEPMTPAEMAGVMAHETLHVALDHLDEAKSGIWSDHDSLQKAHEIVINDRLINEGFILPEDGLFGPNLIGKDAGKMSTTMAYDEVVKKKDQDDNQNHDHKCGGIQLSDENAAKIRQKMANAINNSTSAEKSELSEDMLSDLGDKMSADDSHETGGVGTGSEEKQISTIASKLGIKANWVKLLNEINPDLIRKYGVSKVRYKPNWSAPRRSLAHMYPKVMVPSMTQVKGHQKGHGINKPYIVIALDFSGSVPRNMQDKLKELALSIPKDLIDFDCCTFSTNSVPFFPDRDKNNVASGGTDFSCVEKFAREKAKARGLKYPKAIVCITDGDADFYDPAYGPENLDSWKWLLFNNRTLSMRYAATVRDLIKPENRVYFQDYV